MKLLRRLIAWSFVAGVLTALGVVVFHWVRYQPRFVVEGPHELVHLSDDGRWLVTGDVDRAEAKGTFFAYPARLHVSDTHTGELIRSFDVVRYPSDVVGIISGIPQSPDGRYFACCRETDCLLIDWQSGEQWTVPMDKSESQHECDFSEHGRWLKIRTGDEAEHTVVVEVATGKIARRFPFRVPGFIQDDRVAVCCADTHRLDLVDMATGDVIASFKSSIDLRRGTIAIMATADGRWLAFGNRFSRSSPWSFDDIEIWTVPKRQRQFFYEYEEGMWIDVVFSGRGTHFVTAQWRNDSHKVEVFHLEKHDSILRLNRSREQTLDATILPTFGLSEDCFSPDGRLLLLPKEDGLAVYDVAAGTMLCQKAGAYGEWLAGVGDRLLCTHDTDGGAHVLDASTGVVHARFGQEIAGVYATQATPYGRWALVHGVRDAGKTRALWEMWLAKLGAPWLADSKGLVVVADPATGVERFRAPASDHGRGA